MLRTLSIRSALMVGMPVLLLLAIGVVAVIGTTSIHRSVLREAQERVDRDLSTLLSLYDQEIQLTLERFLHAMDLLDPGLEADERGRALFQARAQLGFAVLNACDPEGRPLAGTHSGPDTRVPVGRDPVLRAALRGQAAYGTVRLNARRLRLEGGTALSMSQSVPRPDGASEGGTAEALFHWFALPLHDGDGVVTGLVYGGRPLNHNSGFVDRLAGTLFGQELHEGKPVGTVTIFLDGTRVATNVRDAGGRRAIGTVVSDPVRQRVLAKGERWRDRAWVVDAWYLSGYEPLRDTDGNTLGMLYVGLLEAPYTALRTRMMRQFVTPTLILLAAGLGLTFLFLLRITRPLERLRESAGRIAAGDLETPVTAGRAYREIAQLSDALDVMQEAIEQRDAKLRGTNEQLVQANRDLARANENYMTMLGFVTHELKGPLANIQSLIDLVVDGYLGEVPEKSRETLVRVKRNCEELQDMVKNYLDLSRAERDELPADKREIDFVGDVVEPCRTQTEALFRSRGVGFEADLPDRLDLLADPELLRIALTNFLTNAAKYGREEGRATLSAREVEGDLLVEVWNEGDGFTAEEGEKLFGKFSRLNNKNTKSKKGSGLGLYLCAQVMERHDGRAWAEAEPGRWARFCFRLPRRGKV